MTIKEMINELNEMIANNEVNEDAIIVNAERDKVFSIIEEDNEVIIYF